MCNKFSKIVLLSLALFFVGNLVYAKMPHQPLFFYSDACPHCQEVQDFIKEQQVERKLSIFIQKKEIFSNKENRQEMGDALTKCHVIAKTV